MSAIATDEIFWDRLARKYAADTIKDVGGYERTLSRSNSYLKPTHRTFEFGCGTGTTALRLSPHVQSIVATDVSGKMIGIAQEKAKTQNCTNVTFRKSTLDDPQWPEEDYDVVFGFNALHMVRDLPRSLSRVHQILKPGGLFISKTPCLRDAGFIIQWLVPVAQFFGKAPHVGMFGMDELRGAMEAANFEILTQEKHGTRGRDFRSFIVARRP
ncbi:MAG: class I SAM-dependent methyltransferase [Aestuariivirga sp.]